METLLRGFPTSSSSPSPNNQKRAPPLRIPTRTTCIIFLIYLSTLGGLTHGAILAGSQPSRPRQSTIAPTPVVTITPYDNENENGNGITTTFLPPPINYNCPGTCNCLYDPKNQHLKISCRKTNSTRSHQGIPHLIHISAGLKSLGLNHLVLNDESLLKLMGHFALSELSLNHVILNPNIFFNSDLFVKGRHSLRKIRMSEITMSSSASPDSDSSGATSSYFSRLENLSSLNLANSPASTSNFLLSILPSSVTHLTIFNSSLRNLIYGGTNRLSSELISLNFSRNEINYLPWGFFSEFPHLISLDLSHNHLQHLQEEVFLGLSALRKLNLSHNAIQYADAYVFTPLISLISLDISHNSLIQIFEPYFEDNVELRTLIMTKTWAPGSFAPPEDTATRSLTEMDKLIDSLYRIESLDLRDNSMKVIPESLSHMPHLHNLNLHGNDWGCSCSDRWVLNWIQSSPLLRIDNPNICQNTMTETIGTANQSLEFTIRNLNCTNAEITARTPRKYYGLQGKSKTLKCHAQKKGGAKLYWTLPRGGQVIHSAHSQNSLDSIDSSYYRVLSNGDLFISNLTADSYGLYICVAVYSDLNITHFVHLGVDTSIFLDIKLASIIIGWLTSFGFLMAVLTIQMIRAILLRYGIDCSELTAPYKVRLVRRFFENMEAHKNTQLEWLRDNYNQQVNRVRDNCTSQVERIRESYTCQTKNLSDIREYGAHQLHTVSEQYHDQIRRVSSYSTQQLCKVRENYVFQRNRVGKFSSHQLLRLRETYKWQAQTVNKILENLPKTLNFDTCRGVGVCGRSDSLYWDEDGTEINVEELLLDPRHLGESLFVHNRLQLGETLELEKPQHVTLVIPAEGQGEGEPCSSSAISATTTEEKIEEKKIEEENGEEKEIEEENEKFITESSHL